MKTALTRFFASKPLQAVALLAAAGALAGVLLADVAPKGARVSLAFTIAEQSRQETVDYAYDGYYSLQASNLIADTMISWLSTPAVIKDIYSGAGLAVSDGRAVAEAGRTFRAKKFSSQNVVVTFSASDPETARKLADQTAKTLSLRAAQLVTTPKNQAQFLVTASEPVITDASVPPAAAAAAGLSVGAFLGLFLAYWARGRKNPQP